MTGHRGLFRAASLALVAAVTGSMPAAVAAQERDADFLFRRPLMSFTLRTGFSLPNTGGEIFDFTSQHLTVDKGDYNTAAFGAELAFRVTERIDVVIGASVSHSSTLSEFRDFVDLDDLPIEQTTEFTRVPTTLSVKYYLWDRGRSIGRFAWIPEKIVPYVGGGAGLVWYQFKQEGEFVDVDTLDIYFDLLDSDGTTEFGHLFAGADLSLGPRWTLNGEGRYSFASTRLDPTYFVGFDDINLGGFEATVGFAIRF